MILKKKKNQLPKSLHWNQILIWRESEEGEAEWGISCRIFHYIRQLVCDKQKQFKFSFLIDSVSLQIMHMNIVL